MSQIKSQRNYICAIHKSNKKVKEIIFVQYMSQIKKVKEITSSFGSLSSCGNSTALRMNMINNMKIVKMMNMISIDATSTYNHIDVTFT